MANCLEFYECRERGCYAADVGMGMFCPGVEAREGQVRQSAPAPDPHVSYVPGEDPQIAALREMVNGNRERLGIDGDGGGEER